MIYFDDIDMFYMNIFYSGFSTAVDCLPDDEKTRALQSAFKYLFEGIEPTESGLYMAVFEFARPYLDYLRRIAGENTDE